jgi:hypothetical protein
MRKTRTYLKFPGFRRYYAFNGSGGFFMYPILLQEYWQSMTGSEQKCMDFILRQTIGWGKSSDAISWSQFEFGVGEANKGTGLSKSQVRRAVAKLEEMGFIRVIRSRNRMNTFELVLDDEDYWASVMDAIDCFRNDHKVR